ncbi:hypothetical protein HanRHA438_Chr04g0193161 [Helianthus annuus]|nr:hypothetical protein HanRHA438_Chr04g0193161 [Helianthus annuus]
MKWHFSQLRARLVSSHRDSIRSRLSRHWSYESPKMEKSSMKTSIVFSIISWKMATIQRWNVAGALHRPNGMRRYAKVP